MIVRNEYKVRIYSEYFLGSYRFLFSIHDLCAAHFKALDDLTHKYLKGWLGMPRGASWALIHDYHGLNVKSIEQLYKESGALSLSLVILVLNMLWKEGINGTGNSPLQLSLRG